MGLRIDFQSIHTDQESISAMSDDRVLTLKVPAEWFDQIEHLCQINGLNRSEYVRGLIAANLQGMPDGMISLGGFNEGYQQGRRLAIHLAHEMLRNARELMPDTYEEAL